jgi:hypothetical protein
MDARFVGHGDSIGRAGRDVIRDDWRAAQTLMLHT